LISYIEVLIGPLCIEISFVQENYKEQTDTLKDQRIRTQWEAFEDNNVPLPSTSRHRWMATLNRLEQYIASNDQIQAENSHKMTLEELATWLSNQKRYYNEQTDIMKDQIIRAQWETFMCNHSDLFPNPVSGLITG
jgi:hypothetical protein